MLKSYHLKPVTSQYAYNYRIDQNNYSDRVRNDPKNFVQLPKIDYVQLLVKKLYYLNP